MAKSKKTRAERAADLLSFYSKKELADSMGVTTKTVNRWIRGENQPSDTNMKKIRRREHYWTSGERERSIKPKEIKGPGLIDLSAGGFELFDLIRRVENEQIDLSNFTGQKRIDHNFDIDDISGGEVQERRATFINPGGGPVVSSEYIGFLYRQFRLLVDRFAGTNFAAFVTGIGTV